MFRELQPSETLVPLMGDCCVNQSERGRKQSANILMLVREVGKVLASNKRGKRKKGASNHLFNIISRYLSK